jgi:hypothetical protein
MGRAVNTVTEDRIRSDGEDRSLMPGFKCLLTVAFVTLVPSLSHPEIAEDVPNGRRQRRTCRRRHVSVNSVGMVLASLG